MNEKRNNDSRAARLPWESRRPVVAIETPEQVELHVPLAPFGTRICAALIDYLVLLTINSVLFLVLLLFVAVSVSTLWDNSPYFTALFTALLSFFNLLYFVFFEFRGRGQTPGKKMVHIRSIMNTGQGLTFSAALLRNLARMVDNVPLLWIVPGLDTSKRRTGDFLAQTLVIDTAAKEKRPVVLSLGDSYAELDQKLFTFTTDILAGVSPEDLNLLEYFFNQTKDPVSAGRRQRRMAEKIAERYVKRLSLAGQEEDVAQNPVRFLEEFYLFLKDRYESRGF